MKREAENRQHQSLQRPSRDEDCRESRRRRIMTHLKESFISQLDPSLSVDSSAVERRLEEVFRGFHTPTHPPYASMIHSAIMGLNEDTGSTEEAISDFIKSEHNDLPWAHDTILGLHLGRLCQVGELACRERGRYALRDAVDDEPETKLDVLLGLASGSGSGSGSGLTRPTGLKVYTRKRNRGQARDGGRETIT